MRLCGGWLAARVKNLGRIFFGQRRQFLAGGGWRLGPSGKAFAVLGGRRFRRRLAAYVGGVWAVCSAALAGGARFGLAAFGG